MGGIKRRGRPFGKARRRVVGCVAMSLLIVGCVTSCTPTTPPGVATVAMSYVDFDGQTLSLVGHLGQHIALLVPPGSWDDVVVDRIVGRLDAAFAYYHSITGHAPSGGDLYKGLDEIAVVPSTCGAGCSYIGTNGIELLQSSWQELYDDVSSAGTFDQVLFYEFGRNFWYLTPKLTYLAPDDDGTVTTGFAVLNRFTSMDAAGVTGGPFYGSTVMPFSQLRSDVEALVDEYVQNPSLNWSNTLAVGQGVPGSNLGSTDLFASMVMRLAKYFGSGIYTHLWLDAENLPDAATTQQAVDNFMLAACAASGRNLSSLFADWRIPLDPAATAAALANWGAPWNVP